MGNALGIGTVWQRLEAALWFDETRWLFYSPQMADLQTTVKSAMDDVRALEQRHGVTREGVKAIKERLIELASRSDLFTFDNFPQPETVGSSFMYRVAQDDNDRFALYVQASSGSVATPPHNHTTWAVVVGAAGNELNRFYERADVGVTQVSDFLVEPGSGVAMLPDDLHSIHLDGPSINLHCYGLALERLDAREYYSEKTGEWKIFSATSGIVEARPELLSC